MILNLYGAGHELSSQCLQIGEAAVRRLNDETLHESFDAAVRYMMKQVHELSGVGARVLDMRGDWACSAVRALQLGARYVLATHVSDGELVREHEPETEGTSLQVEGYWTSILSNAAGAVGGSRGMLEIQSAGIGEMLSAGWEPPDTVSQSGQMESETGCSEDQCGGFDIIITELVDCMGVLIEGVLDDLQLAIQLSVANGKATEENTDTVGAVLRAVPRRILTVPQRAVVYAQLISSVRLLCSISASPSSHHDS